MKRLLTIFFVFASLVLKAQLSPEVVVKDTALSNGPFFYQYDTARIYMPAEYNDSVSKRYPVLFFWHGFGEGSVNFNGSTLENTGLPQLIRTGQVPKAIGQDGKLYRFIVVCYQSPPNESFGIFNREDAYQYLLADVIKNFRVDTARIYHTGLSGGAETVVAFATKLPTKTTAIYPVSFTGYLNQPPDQDSVKILGSTYRVPLWTVTGSNDLTEPANAFNKSLTLVNDYNANTPSPPGIRTVIAGGTHSSNTWNPAMDTLWYANSNNTTIAKNMFQWFLQYQITPPTYTQPKAIVKVYIYTSSTPSAITIVPAVQKFDKTSVFMLSLDDANKEGWNVFQNAQKYHFTDGAGKQFTYPVEYALNSWNSYNNQLFLENPGYNGMTLQQIAESMKQGCSISNHGAYHFPCSVRNQPGWENAGCFDYLTNIIWNEQYFYRKMGELGVPLSIRTWTNPADDPGYYRYADSLGYLAVSSQGTTDNNYITPGGVNDLQAGGPMIIPTINAGFKLYRRDFSDQWENDYNARIKGFLTTILTTSNYNNRKMYRIGSHLNTNAVLYIDSAFQYIQSTANDSCWVTTTQEFEEYHEIKRLVEPTKTITTNGNVTVVTYDFSNVPEKNRWRDMSLKVVVTGAAMQSVFVTGADDYTYNISTGLINFYSQKKAGYSRPYGSTRVTKTKLPLTPDMVVVDGYNITSKEDYLVDGSNNNFALGSGQYATDTVDIYLEVPKNWNTQLDTIKFWDANEDAINNPALFYGIKNTGENVLLATFTGNDYNAWKTTIVTDTSIWSRFYFRKLRVNDNTASRIMPAKVQLIGSYNQDTAYYASYVARDKPVFSRMNGINNYWYYAGNPNDMTTQRTDWLSKANKMSRQRFYFDVCQHFYPGDSTWFKYYDSVFKWMNDRGKEINIALKSMPEYWIKANYPSQYWPDFSSTCLNVLVPAPWGTDWSDPANYVDMAKYCYQIAARYGRNTNIPESFRKSYTPQNFWENKDANVWGLGYVKYFSPGNENDKSWIGNQKWITQDGAELAAQMSACYDGDKGRLGPNVGIKTADPTMIVLPPAFTTAGASDNIMRMMRQWVIEHRGYKADGVTPDWPFDQVDFHNYSSDAGGQYQQTIGKAHEQSAAFGEVDTILKFSGAYMNSMPITMTESGWDTRDTTVNGQWQGTVQNAIRIGSKTVYQTQADWIARNSLVNWTKGLAGIDYYEIADQNDFNTYNGLYGSAGLFFSANQGIYSGNPGVVTNKPSANFVVQLRNLLDNYTVDSVTLRTADSTWTIRASYLDSVKYVVWVGKQSGATAPVTLPVSNGVRYDLDYNSENYNRTTISTGSNYSFTATETPVVVGVGTDGYVPPNGSRFIFKTPKKKIIIIY